MRKPAFLSNERLSRFLVSILLTMGLLLPLMFTFEAESALALAIASATAVTVLCTALGTLRARQAGAGHRGRRPAGCAAGPAPYGTHRLGHGGVQRPFPCISTA